MAMTFESEPGFEGTSRVGLAYRFALVDPSRLRVHEQIVEERVESVAKGLARIGWVRVPIIADAASGTILDGHHRFAALQRLGVRRVPVAFVDYADRRIVVETWRDEKAPSKEEVVARAAAGTPFPPKSTRHRVLNEFDEIPVRLADLR